jgi:hypothetical protein
LPLTKSELHKQKHEGEKDITLDYDIFMKIKQMSKRNKSGALLKPTAGKSNKENDTAKKPAQIYRDRIDDYEAKKKKFGDSKKFIFRQEPREKTWYERQDMKIKGKPLQSSEGLEISQQQREFIKELTSIQSDMGQ